MKNQKKTFRSYLNLVVVALMFVPFVGCAWGISGNGNVISEERQLEDFSKVKVGEGIKLILVQGDETKALIETDENLMEILRTDVSGDVLRIHFKEKVRRTKSRKVTLTFIQLESLAVSSGAHASSKGILNVDQLNLKASSGGHAKLEINAQGINGSTSSGAQMELKGNTENFSGSASSGGGLNAFDLVAKNVNASASSGGRVTANVVVAINANASSGGNIAYKGNPEDVNVKTSSGGNVRKR